ncbi:hypothetical protein PLESTB_000958000 [Pleodorina starrii]|uniref:Methyltransferase FkbM domain-containing protein n=1 Tax=Pleodorina starrii TaxID=330485 RepID=A0A9W6C571_9CHLO|nr:hypothetical protein PLESTM_001140100 [Pleodorina starrii]GLC77827.1 hypothetical protein PLESTB_000958000 [Pleodorina starrii]
MQLLTQTRARHQIWRQWPNDHRQLGVAPPLVVGRPPRRSHRPAPRAHFLSPRASATVPFTLENGLVLRHFTLDELNFLYREVYQERVYLRHGVTIRPGDTVVDVGANTGLFTLLAAEEAGPGGRVVALEPLQRTYQMLVRNVESHAEWCAAGGRQVASPVLLNCGAGAPAPGQESATFVTYSDSASGWSTMYPHDGEVAANMQRYILHMMMMMEEEEEGHTPQSPPPSPPPRGGEGQGDAGRGAVEAAASTGGDWQRQQQQPGAGVPEPALARLARALWWRAPPLRPLLRAAGSLYVRFVMLGGQRRWSCRLVSLSRLIREQRLQRIDLLKVDVERAELDVLYGISSDDWQLIRQVVMEVHDLDGRLDVVRALLESAGFTDVVSEQEPGLAGGTLHMLYAVRRDAPAEAG